VLSWTCFKISLFVIIILNFVKKIFTLWYDYTKGKILWRLVWFVVAEIYDPINKVKIPSRLENRKIWWKIVDMVENLKLMLRLNRYDVALNYRLVEGLPEWYKKRLFEEIEKWELDAKQVKFLKEVGERKVWDKERFSEMKKEKIFTQVRKNEILEDLEKIKDGEDLIKVAEKYQYLDPIIEKNVIFVKWDKEGAMEIIILTKKYKYLS